MLKKNGSDLVYFDPHCMFNVFIQTNRQINIFMNDINKREKDEERYRHTMCLYRNFRINFFSSIIITDHIEMNEKNL